MCPLTGTKSASGPVFGYLRKYEDAKHLAHLFVIPFGMLGTLVFGTFLVPGTAVGLVQCLRDFACCRHDKIIDSPVARFRPVSLWTDSCIVAADSPPPSPVIPIVLGLCLNLADMFLLQSLLPESCCRNYCFQIPIPQAPKAPLTLVSLLLMLLSLLSMPVEDT